MARKRARKLRWMMLMPSQLYPRSAEERYLLCARSHKLGSGWMLRTRMTSGGTKLLWSKWKIERTELRYWSIFLSFGKDDDAWFFVDDDENISGPYTRVADWRSQLRKDEEVEVNRSTVKSTDLKLKGRWLVGKVKRFDRTRTVNGETQAKRKRIENEGGDQMNIYDEGMGPESTTPPTPPPNSTLGTHLHPGMVLLEIRTGTFLSQRKEVWVDLDSEELAQRYTHTVKPKPSYGPQGVQEPPIHSGVVGLRNLGNTCFMNSMLQCLSHTIPLTDYFIRGDYEADLNRKNPLGTGGKLAESFAVLISEIWSDKYSVFAPTDFKQQLGRAFTQFQGYQQQDSHEMFSLLVDGLHEDLNRVRKKPYTEAVEGKGRPDKVVADESWDVFKLRNDSIIVDEMMGLLRSHLTCPVCKEETVKYDAYSNWSIPVPKNKKRPLNLVLYRAVESGDSSGSLPRLERFVGDFSEDSDGGEVVEWLSGKTGLPKSELLLVDMHGNKKATHDFFYDPSQAMDYKGYFDGLKRWDEDKDMFAYHVPKIKLGGGVVPVAQDAMTDDLTPVESEDVIVEIRFVPAETTYKYLRLSDFIRLEGPVTTKQLHRLIWDRVRFMFKDDYSVPQGFLEQFGGHKHDGDTDVMDHHPRDTPSPREDDESCPYRIVDGGHVSGLVDCSDSETWEPKDAIQLEFSATGIQGLRMDTPVQLCSSRATIEEKDEAFALGEVSVHESFGVGRTRQGKRNGIDIYECFDRFREREQLGENDEWFCPKCKELVRAFKRMDLWSTPDTLVIHLKRFYYERSRFMRSWVDREKIKDLVTFPIDGLDLSTYILGDSKEDAIYDCYGVSNHIGGLGGGHYTAYIKSTDNNRWYCMDDSHTSEVDVAEVISPKAYVLFYKRRQSGQPQE
mmetsp:Transcript_41071/g.66103  ORF Transcript_41071/g.66103 Transcript_41071/m.66103 type:complete len:897 (+) Transcript_41071:889-3579(+)